MTFDRVTKVISFESHRAITRTDALSGSIAPSGPLIGLIVRDGQPRRRRPAMECILYWPSGRRLVAFCVSRSHRAAAPQSLFPARQPFYRRCYVFRRSNRPSSTTTYRTALLRLSGCVFVTNGEFCSCAELRFQVHASAASSDGLPGALTRIFHSVINRFDRLMSSCFCSWC